MTATEAYLIIDPAPASITQKTDTTDVADTIIANITRAPSAVLFDRYSETINQKYALDFDAGRDLRARIAGWFFEDTNATGPPPQDASGANLGAADYNNDGASESNLTDIAGTLYRQGQLRLNQSFTDLFTDKVIMGDGSNDATDYLTGNLPGPWSVNSATSIGNHSFHQAWAFRVRREADFATGVLNADDVSGVSSDRGYVAFADVDLSTYWQQRVLAETFLQPDGSNRLGYSALIDHYELDPQAVYGLTDDDYAYMRRQWGLGMLHPHSIPAPRIADTYPAPLLDEVLFDWGAPVGNWYMATLDVSSGTVTVRPQDVANGHSQVFSYGCVVMNTNAVASGWWPSGQASDPVALPSPPSGRRWAHLDASSYISLTRSLAMAGQDLTLNDGAAITNSDAIYPYGYVTLRRGEAVGLRHEAIPSSMTLTREMTVGIDEPMRRAVYCTTDWRNVFDGPIRGQIMKLGRFVWHQGIGAELSSGRPDTYTRLTAWRAGAQEDALLMLHKLPEYLPISEPSPSDGKKYMYNAVWSQATPDDHILKRGNGALLKTEGTPLAVGMMYKQEVCTAVAQEFWQDWADVDGSRTGELDMITNVDETSVAAIYIYDSIPPHQVDRYGQQLHASACLAKPATNEYTLNYWSGAPIAGSPDGSGFYSDWSVYGGNAPMMYGRRNPRTGSFGGTITGVKHINGNTQTVIRYNDSNDGTAGSVGDDITVLNTQRVGYDADWNEDGSDESRTSADAVYRAQHVLRMHTAWQDEFEAITGRRCPKAGNMVNGLHGIFKNNNDGMGEANPFFGAIEIPSYENWLNSIGFYPWNGTGFEVRGIYDPDEVARGIALGRALLRKNTDYSNQFPNLIGSDTLADPSVVLTWELGGVAIETGSTDESAYATYSNNPQFASVARFAAAVGLLKDVATCIAGARLNIDPWLCEEQFFWPGVPLDESLRVIFTFDIATNTVAWNPPHFGTHGYVIPFDNAFAIVNFRDGLSDGDYAQYLPVNDGTTGDLVTVNGQSLEAYSQSLDGKSVYMFDGANYTHRTTDTSSNLYGFQPGAQSWMIRDHSFNDGQLLTTKFPSGLRCVAPGGMILRRA